MHTLALEVVLLLFDTVDDVEHIDDRHQHLQSWLLPPPLFRKGQVICLVKRRACACICAGRAWPVVRM